MPVRSASAEWRGDLKGGKGNITTESKVLNNTEYNFASRFEAGTVTNPEELLGAAHSGCFTMALANALSTDGFKVNSIKTLDKVYLEKSEAGFGVSKIEISTEGDVVGIDSAKFNEYAEKIKSACIISRALASVPMTLSAKLK
jgi:osmotically inducible protein OsmC